jgi:glycosyltransferase involved in cell wall biosynthesis
VLPDVAGSEDGTVQLADRLDGDGAAVPRFSVVIPSRNRLALLNHAIDSVRRQSFSDWEVVVSDNASDEDYGGAIRALDDPRVRCLRSDVPLSVTDNWNCALRGAIGDYVVMLGDDDALAPDYFEALQAIIRAFDEPEIVYSMAYHYAYPAVVPGHPSGYLATINNSPVFGDRTAPYRLGTDEARKLGRLALHFRHEVSFNAQHFLYRRSFIESLASLGPFYQSPYPDYYCCFLSFLKANFIVVDPSPRAIIGISPHSFGFFLMNNREEEGAARFLASQLDEAFLVGGDAKVAAALHVAGSDHTRSWLVAALYVQRRLAGDVDVAVDLRRYIRLQLAELAQKAAYEGAISHRVFWQAVAGCDTSIRAFAARMFRLYLILSRVKILQQSPVLPGVRALLYQYAAANASFHDIGPHTDVGDAVRWLDRGIA